MTFATAISRLNVAVMRHLADCAAVLDNVAVQGAFDGPAITVLAGMVTATDPSFTLPTTAAARARQGSLLRIADGPHAGERYTVQDIQPDGGGLTLLRLQKVTQA